MLLQQIAEFPDQASALRGAHLAPGAIIESFARRFDRQVDIGAITFGDLRQDLSGGRIVGGKSFARNSVNPLSINEHFAWLLNKAEDARINLCRGNGSHGNLLDSGLAFSAGNTVYAFRQRDHASPVRR